MQQKPQIRHVFRKKRQAHSPHQQQDAANKINKILQQHPRIQQSQHIGLYLSFDGEISTQPIIHQLWQKNKSLYLPVRHPTNSRQLVFLPYTTDTKLAINSLGLSEPKWDIQSILSITTLEIVLIPLVAFDNQGNRLGMGGGYYDQMLQHWPENNIYPIGLAHNCQLVDKLPVESWDIRLPEIITPDKTWQW